MGFANVDLQSSILDLNTDGPDLFTTTTPATLTGAANVVVSAESSLILPTDTINQVRTSAHCSTTVDRRVPMP